MVGQGHPGRQPRTEVAPGTPPLSYLSILGGAHSWATGKAMPTQRFWSGLRRAREPSRRSRSGASLPPPCPLASGTQGSRGPRLHEAGEIWIPNYVFFVNFVKRVTHSFLHKRPKVKNKKRHILLIPKLVPSELGRAGVGCWAGAGGLACLLQSLLSLRELTRVPKALVFQTVLLL